MNTKELKKKVEKLKLLIDWLEDVWEISEDNYSGYKDWIVFKQKIDKIFNFEK